MGVGGRIRLECIAEVYVPPVLGSRGEFVGLLRRGGVSVVCVNEVHNPPVQRHPIENVVTLLTLVHVE